MINKKMKRLIINLRLNLKRYKKGFKYIKKNIIDLGKLLILSNKKSKINKNFAVNKQSIIEEFNNMMLV